MGASAVFGIAGILLVAAVIFWQQRRMVAMRQERRTLDRTIQQLEAAQEELTSKQQQLQSALQSSQHDAVTGLYTWPIFMDRLRQAIKESKRYDLTLGVMTIDLDHFKILNDALGHAAGDTLLRETAKRLSTCIRQVDSITRQSKDRFVVLLAQLSKAERAAVVAARMLEAVSEPFLINDHEFYATACIGIAFYPGDGEDAETLLVRAENALVAAKEKGKHLYQFHQSEVHLQSERELELITDLHKEAIYNELQIYYQPVFNITTSKIAYMDALLYWQHRHYGLITPPDFFRYAENQRKSNEFCEWLIRKALQQFVVWQSKGLSIDSIAVPVFMHQLENSQFVYQVMQLFQEYQVNPHHVVIEIKEEVFKIAFDKVESAINRFRYLGVKIAISEFGAGYLPFNQWSHLTVDYLKLDPRCIDNIADDPTARRFIHSLKLFADANEMKLIVQGVNAASTRAALSALGIELLQGDFLAPPWSTPEVEAKILEKYPV